MADKVMTAEARIKATYTGDGFARAAADARRASKDLNALGGSRGLRNAARDMRDLSIASKAIGGQKLRAFDDIVRAQHAARAMRGLRPSDYALARTVGMGAFSGPAGAGAGLGGMALGRGGALAAGVIAPAAIAYAATQNVKTWADLESAITRVGITADASKDQVANALQLFRAQGPAMGATAREMAGAADVYVAAGLDYETAIGSVPETIKAAKASGGTVLDLTSAGVAAIQQFGFTADTLGQAFDQMAYGGKLGRYELASMAKDLPSVGAGARRLGLEGAAGLAKTVAALEIIREYTGSSDEAANRWENIAQKAFAPETVKNFKKMGVDLEKEIKGGATRGVDAFQVLLEQTQKLTKGDPFKIGQLFGDAQVIQGMTALLPNLSRLAKDTSDILKNSKGTIQKDFGRIGETTQQSIDRMSASFDRMSGLLGERLSKVVVPAMDHISDVLEGKLGTPQEALDARRDFRLPGGARMTPEQYDAMQRKIREREERLNPTDPLAKAGVRSLGPSGVDAAMRAEAARERAKAQAEVDDLRRRADLEDSALGTRGAINQHRRRNRDQQIAELERRMALPDAAVAVAAVQAAQGKWGAGRRAFSPIGWGDPTLRSFVGVEKLGISKLPAPASWGGALEPNANLPAVAPLPPVRPDIAAPILDKINAALGDGKIEATVKPDQVKAELTGSAEVTGTGQITIKIDDGAIVRAMAQQNQAIMQLRGQVRAGKASSTSMPQYEK